MNTASKISSMPAWRAPDMGIDWEFQPSLQHLVKRTEDGPQGEPTWVETMPAQLEAMDEPVEFSESLEGLSVRDIDEPEIFRVFFGGTRAQSARA